MRYEWALDIIYTDNTVKRLYFFTKTEALQFKEDMARWQSTLGIADLGEPIELHPRNAFYSPWTINRIDAYIKSLK